MVAAKIRGTGCLGATLSLSYSLVLSSSSSSSFILLPKDGGGEDRLLCSKGSR